MTFVQKRFCNIFIILITLLYWLLKKKRKTVLCVVCVNSPCLLLLFSAMKHDCPQNEVINSVCKKESLFCTVSRTSYGTWFMQSTLGRGIRFT